MLMSIVFLPSLRTRSDILHLRASFGATSRVPTTAGSKHRLRTLTLLSSCWGHYSWHSTTHTLDKPPCKASTIWMPLRSFLVFQSQLFLPMLTLPSSHDVHQPAVRSAFSQGVSGNCCENLAVQRTDTARRSESYTSRSSLGNGIH